MKFPERQIYIRSGERVHSSPSGRLPQPSASVATFRFWAWSAFTSVNVVFKDRILSVKERHFEQMQIAYEDRIAKLQLAYDELNGALLTAQDNFKSVADEFEAKQRALSGLIEVKETLRASLGIAKGAPPKVAETTPSLRLTNVGSGGSLEFVVPDIAASFAPPFGMGAGTVIGSMKSSPQSERAPFLRGAVERLGSLFGRRTETSGVDTPAIHEIAEQQARITQLEATQQALLAGAKSDFVAETARLRRALQITGITPQAMVKRLGQGGPLVSAAPTMQDAAFRTGVVDTTTSLNDLAMVVKALNAMPLDRPLATSDVSSGFGGRPDPFTEEPAFHSGIDFSAAKGSEVYATADGIVVFAGPRGAYG